MLKFLPINKVKSLVELFGYLNIFVFAGFMLYYDVIERPNVIGYGSLVISLTLSLLHYLSNHRDLNQTLWFAFMICICQIAVGHNVNYLVSTAYRGPTEILDARPGSHFSENWRLQLAKGKVIDLHLYSTAPGDAFELRLRKGLFGVYFGKWQQIS